MRAPISKTYRPFLQQQPPFITHESNQSVLHTVQRRVIRQFIEAGLYEGMFQVEVQPQSMDRPEHTSLFIIKGHPVTARYKESAQRTSCDAVPDITYRCSGSRMMSYGRYCLDHGPVIRIQDGIEAEALDIEQCVLELLAHHNVEGRLTLRFIDELQQTVINDSMCQKRRIEKGIALAGKSYEELESALMEGHLYHPCYKSRMGWDVNDHRAYSPEFSPSIELIWLAVRTSYVHLAMPIGHSYKQTWQSAMGQQQWDFLTRMLRAAGQSEKEYAFVPVHPWQWHNQLYREVEPLIAQKWVVVLGTTGTIYRPQQSLRTLTNYTDALLPYIKLSLHMTNTSSVRSITPHSIASAPAISAWLHGIVERDSFLCQEAKVIILQEYAGCYCHWDRTSNSDTDGNDSIAYKTGSIWRESLVDKLEDGEQAAPFHALFALDLDGQLYVKRWLEAYGAVEWLKQLIETCVLPVIHLLVQHGIALEAHGQNMIIVHRDGRPVRVALKDFHEGVEFVHAHLAEPEHCPDFASLHPVYQSCDRDEHYEMSDINYLTALTHDCLFVFNLSELAIKLQHANLITEKEFWRVVVDVIESHRQQDNTFNEKFAAYDLYREECAVEKLAYRRLVNGSEWLLHHVPNPLHTAYTLKMKSR
ncbi:siderophore biosynthesis protein [Paenibacillus sp. ACRRX]|uniref:IucA/IucC family protein n=1 Tax=Paenibacillus sp. ACRRX TaxID=2918206 RepID=UPI001EF742FC|nr:IucA/IucC family protein [Paenibacillus sp. ACRRX]MCG7407366.1 siderophore biosynthesis protein [Paenibacillus sp. ACRRX]